MAAQQFCLKWNNHQGNLVTVFNNLLTSQAFVDVTLACEGNSIKAHKMVLSACSPFFEELFKNNPCQHPIVILKDVSYHDLKAVVEFMYKGEVNISQDQLSALLKVAETLKVKGLAEGQQDSLPEAAATPSKPAPAFRKRKEMSSFSSNQFNNSPQPGKTSSQPAIQPKVDEPTNVMQNVDPDLFESHQTDNAPGPSEPNFSYREAKHARTDDDDDDVLPLSPSEIKQQPPDSPQNNEEFSYDSSQQLSVNVQEGTFNEDNAMYEVDAQALSTDSNQGHFQGSQSIDLQDASQFEMSQEEYLDNTADGSNSSFAGTSSMSAMPGEEGGSQNQEQEVMGFHRTQVGQTVCQICSKTFSNTSNLNRHIRVYHVRERFACKSCSRSYTSRESLREHMISKHGHINRFKCPQCSASFQRLKRLQYHMQDFHT